MRLALCLIFLGGFLTFVTIQTSVVAAQTTSAAPTVTPQPSPTPAPTATPQPSPTPVPSSDNQTNPDKGNGATTILIFFGVFILGTLLAVFVSTRRIGRSR